MSDDAPKISLTSAAATEMSKIAADEGLQPVVRAMVRGGGCAGFTYDMYFDSKIGDLDEVVEQHGVKIIIDPVSLQYMEGSIIDYERHILKSSGFVFKNPKSTGSCGCGNSFSA